MIRAMTDSTICKALQNVLGRIAVAAKSRPMELQIIEPRLVAVSKTKPVGLVQEAYNCGQRHFGENYVQELEEKGKNAEILRKCQDIKWHFIGHLQRNKVNKVLSVPNMWMIETVDSAKLASAVDKCWEKQASAEQLKVLIQINTSSEPQKHGILPDEVCTVVSHVYENCPHLQFCGLMTIGSFDHDLSQGPNPDFQSLIKCKERLCTELKLDPSKVELSMGMSNDFEHAIEIGSCNVRVGSTIFGAREYKSKEKPSTTAAVASAVPQSSQAEAAATTASLNSDSVAGNEASSSKANNGFKCDLDGDLDDDLEEVTESVRQVLSVNKS